MTARVALFESCCASHTVRAALFESHCANHAARLTPLESRCSTRALDSRSCFVRASSVARFYCVRCRHFRPTNLLVNRFDQKCRGDNRGVKIFNICRRSLAPRVTGEQMAAMLRQCFWSPRSQAAFPQAAVPQPAFPQSAFTARVHSPRFHRPRFHRPRSPYSTHCVHSVNSMCVHNVPRLANFVSAGRKGNLASHKAHTSRDLRFAHICESCGIACIVRHCMNRATLRATTN